MSLRSTQTWPSWAFPRKRAGRSYFIRRELAVAGETEIKRRSWWPWPSIVTSSTRITVSKYHSLVNSLCAQTRCKGQSYSHRTGRRCHRIWCRRRQPQPQNRRSAKVRSQWLRDKIHSWSSLTTLRCGPISRIKMKETHHLVKIKIREKARPDLVWVSPRPTIAAVVSIY